MAKLDCAVNAAVVINGENIILFIVLPKPGHSSRDRR